MLCFQISNYFIKKRKLESFNVLNLSKNRCIEEFVVVDDNRYKRWVSHKSITMLLTSSRRLNLTKKATSYTKLITTNHLLLGKCFIFTTISIFIMICTPLFSVFQSMLFLKFWTQLRYRNLIGTGFYHQRSEF